MEMRRELTLDWGGGGGREEVGITLRIVFGNRGSRIPHNKDPIGYPYFRN